MPHLIAFYFVKSRELVLLQQEINTGAKITVAIEPAGQGRQRRQNRRPVYFPESPSFNMGSQL
jgi:hypothetical protein